MNVRLAACDPCRRAKLACGHERPTCVRCRSRGQADVCVYRSQPFKRRKPRQSSHSVDWNASPVSVQSPQPHRYPNPGFLGPSSHSALFRQVSSSAGGSSPGSRTQNAGALVPNPSPAEMANDQVAVNNSVTTLRQLGQVDVANLTALVNIWLGEGVNLPLAGPMVPTCVEAVSGLWSEIPASSPGGSRLSEWISDRARFLLRNTHVPLDIRGDTTFDEFLAQMRGESVRWETLGIFITAATRAALDTISFPPLYSSEGQRRSLITALTSLGDSCLEKCLAVDCLNGLQLMLQYENFVVHSQVEGDQSYHCWRRMGDLSSSLFALGYHEKINDSASPIPNFIVELRKATFARIYAADKSLAIFLGRPPRIIKAYCNLQLPSYLPCLWDQDPTPARDAGVVQDEPEPINYTADTRCSASFACLKEDILGLSRLRFSDDLEDRIRTLRSQIEAKWLELPSHFRLSTSLKECHVSRFERDFLVTTRLDYLHTLLLLHLISSRRTAEPDESLLLVAEEMLSLVVEVIILRDRLVNSGSSLIWKVAQYGLPAAGVVSLALLTHPVGTGVEPFSRTKMVQDLSVLVAEIRTGAVIQDGEPNFALFTRATQTIQSLLDSLMVWRSPGATANVQPSLGLCDLEDWGLLGNLDPWEFEFGFWANLAEHPTLLNQES